MFRILAEWIGDTRFLKDRVSVKICMNSVEVVKRARLLYFVVPIAVNNKCSNLHFCRYCNCDCKTALTTA